MGLNLNVQYVKIMDQLIAEMETLQKEIKRYRNGTEVRYN